MNYLIGIFYYIIASNSHSERNLPRQDRKICGQNKTVVHNTFEVIALRVFYTYTDSNVGMQNISQTQYIVLYFHIYICALKFRELNKGK